MEKPVTDNAKEFGIQVGGKAFKDACLEAMALGGIKETNCVSFQPRCNQCPYDPKKNNGANCPAENAASAAYLMTINYIVKE